MGKGLVLFKIKADSKAMGQNYHYFYEDMKKPPLDIAINPHSNMIEYVSFFAQDEKIEQTSVNLNIKLTNKNIEFYGLDTSFNNMEEVCVGKFNLNFYKCNLYLISLRDFDSLMGYQLNKNNYILFDRDNNFCGMLFNNIGNKEINEMKQSNVL